MNHNLVRPWGERCSPPQTPYLTFHSPPSGNLLFDEGESIELRCQAGLRALALRWALHRNTLQKPFREGAAEALPANRFVVRLATAGLHPGFYDLKVELDTGVVNEDTDALARRPVQGVCTFGWKVADMAIADTRPADFTEFWTQAKATLSSIPLDASEGPMQTFGKADIDAYNVTSACLPTDYDPTGHRAERVESCKVSFAGPDGGRVFGQLAKPEGPGPFPAMLVLPGGGFAARPRPLEHARHGYVALDIQVHGQDVDLDEYPRIEGYYGDVRHDPPSANYYYNVHLRCVQAVSYLASRPDVDPARIVVVGGSQGGRTGLVLAGLDPRVAAVVAAIPHYANQPYGRWAARCNGFAEPGDKQPDPAIALTDGMELTGAPPVPDDAMGRCSAYYDPMNYAPTIRCPVLMNAGLVDPVSPPSSVWAAYNRLGAADRTLVAMDGHGHDWSAEFDRRAWRWLDRIGQGALYALSVGVSRKGSCRTRAVTRGAMQALWAATLLYAVGAQADVTLPAILSDHAVLQRSEATRIWGTAAPGEKLSVAIAGQSAATTAGTDGQWKVELDLKDAAAGPFELVVEGENRVVVKDVVVGDLWVCSGQSNMAFDMAYALGAEEAIALSTNPWLRQFSVKGAISDVPLDEVRGSWIVANPETAGSFTAVGYYFGSRLQRELGLPVGLIKAAYSASSVTSWTSQAGLNDDEREERARLLGLPDRFKAHVTRYREWEERYSRKDTASADAATWAEPDIDTSAWTPVQMPGALSAGGLPDAGAVWLRRRVLIDGHPANKPLRLCMDPLRFGAVYWNGVKVDEMTPDTFRLAVSWEPAWTIVIPARQVRQGESILAIRLFSPAGGAGLAFRPERSPLLAGEWLAKAEYAFPALDDEAKQACPGIPPVKDFHDHFVPSSLFDGMIHPLLACRVKGVIWYQGEGNAHRPALYRTQFPRVIRDWRAAWGGELPFYFCQLPNQGAKQDLPGESRWAELREAQTLALALPATGQAVLIDTADAELHPRNKRDPGERLALLALAQTYGRSIVCSGPVFDSMRIDGHRVRIRFSHADGGLVARPLPVETVLKYTSVSPDSAVTAPLILPRPDSELQGFALCGADGTWTWADAKIEPGPGGDEVVAWSDAVPQPVAVRYAWADNPTCNLSNAAGLPATPFQSRLAVMPGNGTNP